MNLKRRLLLTSSAIVLITVALTAVAYTLLSQMNLHIHSVSEEYDELQQIEQIDDRLASARADLLSQNPDLSSILAEARTARDEIAEYIEEQDEQVGASEEHTQIEENSAHRVAQHLNALIRRLEQSPEAVEPKVIENALADIAAIHTDLQKLSRVADDMVDDAIDETNDAVSLANTAMLGLCGLGVCLAILFTVLQYRWFINPIQRLRDRVRKTVTDENAENPVGSDLIGDLNAGFTELVAELNDLYNTLEERVTSQSRELVKSERLASVGYLAAGVAHEINNPLNAILGYSELMLRSFNNGANTATKQDVESLEVIRAETFRCRQIVDKLLALVRHSDAPREPVDLTLVAQEVISILNTLKQFRQCQFSVDVPEDLSLMVSARESEMKQILLNLAINAAEATSGGTGVVTISGEADGDHVVLRVRDNGKGLTPDVRARVFEPFFTQKRGSGQSGTGLGLSIVHAIVHDHKGTIIAESEGPGTGSCFTIRLPRAVTVDAS